MLYLASQSPRRRQLLEQIGVAFTPVDVDVPERREPGELPLHYVSRVARDKARAGMAGLPPDALVLSADTEVVLDDEVFGKPADAADAAAMLRRLSGRTHQVLTGIAAATREGVRSAIESTSVTFSVIPEVELDAYCATAEPLDKAGAYGIQGYAARWVPRIDGCYFNVMGLPIARTVALLQAAAERLRT